MKKTELVNLIESAINRKTDLIAGNYGDKNPQVIALTERAKGSKDALSDVLSAIQGNPVYLRILAGK